MEFCPLALLHDAFRKGIIGLGSRGFECWVITLGSMPYSSRKNIPDNNGLFFFFYFSIGGGGGDISRLGEAAPLHLRCVFCL